MKRTTILLLASLILAGLASAEDISFSSITPKTTKSIGLGGVFTSVPTAEFSFFGNPANFAASKGTLITPSVDVWGYFKPTNANFKAITKDPKLSTALDLMNDNGGMGFGASTGFGFAGRGLGLGLFATTDNFAEGSNPASAIVHSDTEADIIIGLGFPIQLGDFRLTVGGDLRPFYRLRLSGADNSSLALVDIVNDKNGNGEVTDRINTDAFFGTAMDLGATLQFSSLTVGLSIRDIAPPFPIATGTLTSIKDTLGSGKLPDTTNAKDKAVFKPNISTGVSWTPKLLPGLIDPALYLELADPVSVFKEGGSFWNLLHTGAEIRLLSMITLRGGINRGWLSAGAGIRLLFIEANVAFFTEELGPLPGDKPRSGLAFQSAIRF